MTTYLAHNITKAERINCEPEEAALFEIHRVTPDAPWVGPEDGWEIPLLPNDRVGTGKIIHHGVGPRDKTA